MPHLPKPKPNKYQAAKAADLPPACSAWIDPEQDKPEWTGKYLVWTFEGPDILRIEEGFIEYSDGSAADWDEIRAWAEVRKPNDPDHRPVKQPKT